MKWTSVLAIYALFWVMSAFILLPFGVRTHDEAGIPKVPGQADSARAMIHAARTAAAGDIELLPLEASARLKLNQREESLQLLNRYLELNPSARNRVENGRMFRALRESPPR